MGVKPAKLCYLKKGQIIDAQPGFVDTFNWMVDFINNLTGEEGIKVDKTVSDRPVIKPDDSSNGEYGEQVLVGVEYDHETHVFTQKLRRLPKHVNFSDKEASSEVVFTATEIEV